jgi:hypothetical protein
MSSAVCLVERSSLNFYFLTIDLRIFVDFCETRAPQSWFSASSDPSTASYNRVGHRWPGSGHHEPRSLLSLGRAWWSSPTFFGPCKVVLGNMESDLLQGHFGDSACATRTVFPAKTASLLSTWVGFFCFAMFVYSHCFSSHSLPLYCSNFIEIFVGL